MSNPLKYGAGLDSDKEIAIQSSDLPEAVTPEYSTLEVVTAETESRFAEYNKPAPQLVLNPFRDDASAPEVISFDGKEPIKANEEVLEKPRRRRRHLFLIALIISAIVVVVAAAVLGALAGTHKISLEKVPGAAADSVDGCQTNSTGPGLAAISWLDSSSNTTYLRVFFQNSNTNGIIQSSWDSAGDSWAITPVTDASVDVRQNSPIAAAVSNVSDSFDIHVFYLGSNDTVQASYATDPNDEYKFDNLLMAEGLTADDNTDLAATWHDCDDCPDTVLLVFQDENQRVKLRNGTFTGTTTEILPVQAVPGSSLTISALDDTDDSGLRLAFQGESNDTTGDCSTGSVLSVATWSDDPDTGVVSWAQEDPKIDKAITNLAAYSPLAAFTMGHGTGMLGKLNGEWQVAQIENFKPVMAVDMLPVPGLKRATDIAQLTVSKSKDLFILSASNGTLAHWTLQGDQDQWHYVEQIQTTL